MKRSFMRGRRLVILRPRMDQAEAVGVVVAGTIVMLDFTLLL